MALSPNPLIGYGFTLKEPKLYDVLDALRTQILINLNCVKIGKIAAFYPATHTADVEILFQRVLTDGTTASYPKLLGCPIFTLQGGGASMQFPITIGDQCIVLFSDRNIDNWYLNGNQQPPIDGRLHDLSDGIALVGLNFSTSTAIAPTSTSEARLILKDGLTKVGLQTGKITVQNATQSLLTVLTNLTTALATLNTAIATTSPTNISTAITAATANEAAITAVQTALSALLY